ncbi:MAG TPA: 16S rRNA (guanine(527)-N(7))-methyltransferase RsmG [Sunxiuqinia sp.]|nr:16S rRNA (guanine(527)-N(7))-methyltransferase RsmG [Sunxiuqinia sp.]
MEIIKKYFTDLTEKQFEQLTQMGQLYMDWNEKINVISRKDIEFLYLRHVLHSMSVAKFIQFTPGTSIMDVGTGGGFPGVPLAILFPETNFLLVDSIAKKIKVVEGVSRSLGLQNVRAIQARAEKVDEKFDFVVSRAVTAFPKFVALVRKKIHQQQKNSMTNGILYLKGGDFMKELGPYRDQVDIYDMNQFFTEDYFETKNLLHLKIG